MADHRTVPLADGRTVQVLFSAAADGDFRVLDPTPGLDDRRDRLTGETGPWSWLRQVHGASVFQVTEAGQHAGIDGDGLWTMTTGCPISVTTADCAPVVLVAERGVATVHAGWRGLVAGIVERAAEELIEAAGEPVTALLGPCIGPGAYRFGPDELAVVVGRYGPAVAGTTDAGEPALDVPAAVAAACEASGWPAPPVPACTSNEAWFSHRTRSDRARQCAVAWIDDAPDGAPDDALDLDGAPGGVSGPSRS